MLTFFRLSCGCLNLIFNDYLGIRFFWIIGRIEIRAGDFPERHG